MTEKNQTKTATLETLPRAGVDLLSQHGELMSDSDLIKLFRFKSERTFRRACSTGRLPIQVVRIHGRPGWFARTRDVVEWLDTLIPPNE